jgi:hypothetical protein
MFSVTFADGTKKEQIKACVEKVKSDGRVGAYGF